MLIMLAETGAAPMVSYGVKGRSLLLDLSDLDPVMSLVPEAMHMAFLASSDILCTCSLRRKT